MEDERAQLVPGNVIFIGARTILALVVHCDAENLSNGGYFFQRLTLLTHAGVGSRVIFTELIGELHRV